ncbi:MAG TPA: sigma-54 dependent transcriptional regulator [bacterium]|nr:sigma-54 dependent transcriptional regulator [bacterium]HPQ65544.1 sigma-54 dependent transcriptional regulator [bacterium]
MKKATILIVDDEKNSRTGLEDALNLPGYRVLTAENGFQAEEILAAEQINLVISDLRMPGMTGLDLLKRGERISPGTLFIIMTAYGSVDSAVEAMKEGAFDYLTKPVNIEQLELLVARALKSQNLEAENKYLREQLEKRFGFESLIGKSAAMERVIAVIRQIAGTRSTVLISGESGTGKEVVARTIHQQSPRRAGPFVPVHCAALSPSLLESELFGHEKGAFTGAIAMRKGRFEVADGGTVFLDEVGEIPPEIQVKLLRFLETREFERVGGSVPIRVDIRLLAASNADLDRLRREGRFRDDLYYRLNVVRIDLPPLRRRQDDIPLLARTFAAEFAAENGLTGIEISPEAMHRLQAYSWPGNVRELRNCLESMVVLARGRHIGVEDLPPPIREAGAGGEGAVPPPALNLKIREKDSIGKALKHCRYNKAAAARMLGISRRTLYRKLREYGLEDRATKAGEE